MTETIVTGGYGFIGKHLIKKLHQSRLQSIHFPHKCIVPNFPYDCDNLFFLSTYGNMANHNNNMEMVKANVLDLLTMLHGTKDWICYMSSSSVLLPVQTPYSRTKRAAEEILQALPELKSCIVRPYSVTGVGEQKEHLIPTLIRSCMEGEEMPFDPNPVHDFVDVEDVCDSLIRLADEQAIGIHEFGKGIPHSNYEIRQLVEHATGKKANVKYVDRVRDYDNDHWFCKNPSSVWKTTRSVGHSILEMVEDYKLTH